MTTVVWHKRKLYADSRYTNNGEKFDSLTKVTQFATNYRIFSEEHKVEDKLLGFFCTGSQTAAKGVVEKMIQLYGGDIDLTLSAIKAAWAMNLFTRENHTEVLLVGNKHIYSLLAGIGERVDFRKYDLDGTFHLGSGGDYAATLMMREDVVPLRAMHATLYKDDYSGGLLEVWQHFENDDPEKDCDFFRVFIDDPLNRDLEYSVANLTKPYIGTFIHQKLGFAKFSRDLGVREPGDVELIKAYMAEVNAERDAVQVAAVKARERKQELAFRRFVGGKRALAKMSPEEIAAARTRWVKENTIGIMLSAPTGPSPPILVRSPSELAALANGVSGDPQAVQKAMLDVLAENFTPGGKLKARAARKHTTKPPTKNKGARK
jgi:hypothetical protein